MKKLAVISAVVFTTLTLQSCRQSDEVMSPEEIATLQKVQDSSSNSRQGNTTTTTTNNNAQQKFDADPMADGEIVPPPRK